MRSGHRQLLLGNLVLFAYFVGVSAVWADVFPSKIEPFAKKYCNACHNKKQARGELDLTRYTQDADVTKDFRRWNHVIEFIRKGEMPPNDKEQPTLEERDAVIGAIEGILLVEAKKNAGDPGVVLPRRLSNTEYDLSIRDLTGVAIHATKEFPIDPAGGEGFDNTGEALTMTPSLLSKYLGAAQFVSDHLMLKPDGITFSPFPVTSYAERTKLTEQAIIDFYRKHDVRILDYLEAAWRYRHRSDADRGATLPEWASKYRISPRYLSLVWTTLHEAKTSKGYLKQLGDLWDSVPPPTTTTSIPSELEACDRFIAFARGRLGQKEPPLIVPNAGNWPIGHLAVRAKVAAGRDQFDPQTFKAKHLLKLGRLPMKKVENASGTTLFLRVEPAFDSKPGVVVFHRPVFSKGDNLPRNKREIENQGIETLRSVLERDKSKALAHLTFGKDLQGGTVDADSFVVRAPADLEIPLGPAAVAALQGKQLLVECEVDGASSPEAAVLVRYSVGSPPTSKTGTNAELLLRPESHLAAELTTSNERFCSAFPNRFFYVDAERGLSAGFHLVEGFFRDDQPLVKKVLSDAERQELDRLWKELHFVTQSVETLLRGFVWFERAERHVLHDKRFDFLRSEDPHLIDRELLAKFERHYLEKLGVKLRDDSIEPVKANPQFDLIHGFFEQVREGLAEYKQSLTKAEEPALKQMETLAERAYCRPLRSEEAKSLRGLYQRLRGQGQNVEASLRGTFTAVLMSPHFFYRVPSTPTGAGVHPLADEALARRLSYFLWSSLPDQELLLAARESKLHDENALKTHVRRMMKDSKVEAFAREFFGQWLRYRDYLAKDPIPPNTFPGYDAQLRQAMFEEPTRLLTHLIQNDAPIDALLQGDTTFVNEPLARFYGGTIESQFRRQFTERAEDFKRKGERTRRDPSSDWHRVDGLRSLGRGGLFGMPVILATNSVGQRTSPVKRGFWVVHHVLGQHFPPPPPAVPELPKSEKESAKTIREMLAQHTTNRQCAMCHVHFDGLGLTLEGFDVIGRARTKDLAGRPIQAVGLLPGGKNAEGISGLIDYIKGHRQQDFERNLCRKFLGYALGRSVVLSDEPLLREMEKKLATDRRFSVLFETVVSSPQFRRQRGRDYVAAAP